MFAFAQRLLRPLAFGNVADDLGGADDGAIGVPDRGNRQGYVEIAAIPRPAQRFVMFDPLASPEPRLRISLSSSIRSGGKRRVIDCPTISPAPKPKMRAAPAFQLMIAPSSVLLRIASDDEVNNGGELRRCGFRALALGDFIGQFGRALRHQAFQFDPPGSLGLLPPDFGLMKLFGDPRQQQAVADKNRTGPASRSGSP